MTQLIRVLVVDDDPLQIELIERALSRDGFELRGVTSCDAVATATQGFTPDLVLLDVNMPDSAPERVIAIVRDAAGGARIVLYSAWETSRLRGIATTLGVDAYVSKSESVMTIGRRLRDLCGGNDEQK